MCLPLLVSSTGVIIEKMDSEDSGWDLLVRRRKFFKTRFVKVESITEGNCGICLQMESAFCGIPLEVDVKRLETQNMSLYLALLTIFFFKLRYG